MIYRFYEVLTDLKLQYHELGEVNDTAIYLTAKSLEAEGVMEVMQIKELADRYSLITKWDGQNIQIAK